jgi:outer membrane cobalamin receptor
MGRRAVKESEKTNPNSQETGANTQSTPFACEGGFMRAFRLVVFCLFVFLISTSAFALDLKVHVADPSSAMVSGARVAVYAENSSQALALARSDAQGVATFRNLPGEAVRVEVLAPGFATLTVSVTKSGDVAAQLKLARQGETVVVSATPSPLEAGLTGLNVSTLDAATLTTMQPIAVADAIRFLPGVILGDSGNRGGQTSLFVRGGNSDYNKVLVDGVPVSDPGGYFDFGTTSMTGTDRLELMRGSESVLYGSDAMSSVLQINSATGHTKIPELRFGADGGNFGTAHGSASVAGANGRYDYNVFGDQFQSNGQGVNDDYGNSTQGANLGMQIAPNESLRLRVRHNDSRSGVPGETTFLGKQFFPAADDAWAHQNNLLASLEFNLAAPAKWQHQLMVYNYNHQRHDTDLGTDTSESCYPYCAFAAVSDINHFGVRYGGEYWESKQARTSFGYELEDENGFIGDTTIPSNNHGRRLKHNVYGEQLLEVGGLTVIAGVRYINVGNYFPGSTPSTSHDNWWVPRGSLTYLLARHGLFSGTRLKGSYSLGVKEPSLEQTFGFTGYGVFPNPDLKPEKARTLEAGVEQRFGSRIGATATYFNALYGNQITTNGNYSEYINLNKSLAHGAELDLSGRISQSLRLQGSYFYTSTQILASPLGSFPEAAGDPLLLRPKHAGTLLLAYNRPRYGATLGGSFIGRRADSDFYGLGYTYAAGYARVDAGGWYRVERHVTLYANVENLLNQHYEEVLGYPALTASFRAGMRFHFGGE